MMEKSEFATELILNPQFAVTVNVVVWTTVSAVPVMVTVKVLAFDPPPPLPPLPPPHPFIRLVVRTNPTSAHDRKPRHFLRNPKQNRNADRAAVVARVEGRTRELLVAGTVETAMVDVSAEEVGTISMLEILLQKAQLGSPVHEMVIVWLNPFAGATVTTVVAICPLVIVAEAGLTDNVKLRLMYWLPWGMANFEMNPTDVPFPSPLV
jgi:hypothetical protein